MRMSGWRREMRPPLAMVVTFRSLLRTIAVMALACVCNGDHSVTYKIAVAQRSGTSASDQWGGTFETFLNGAFEKQGHGSRFQIEPININEANNVVGQKLVDFVFFSPNLIMCNQIEFGLEPIATVRQYHEGTIMSEYGTIIFSRASDTSINSVHDIRNRVIEATSAQLCQAQWETLERMGLSLFDAPSQVRFSGDQGKIVDDVLEGRADFGFVRADFLKKKDDDAKALDPSSTVYSADKFKVLNPQEISSAISYPFPSTSLLIPEYSLAALSHVPFELRNRVALALNSLNQSSPEAIAGNHAGFRVPPLTMRNMRSIFDQLKLINKQESTGTYVCNNPSDLYSSIQCPAGTLTLPEQDVKIRCGLLGRTCPEGYSCVCKPCFNASEVEVFPVPQQIFDDLAEEHFNKTNIQISETELAQVVSTSFSRVIGWGAAASPCKSMRLCAEAGQGQSIKILIVDYLKRKGVVSWQLFAGGENLVGNNTVSQTDTTVFALTGATISMLEFSSTDVGTLVLDVSVGDEKAVNSPFLITIKPADCSMYSNREPDVVGTCVCSNGHVFVEGECWSLSAITSAVAVPIIAFIILVSVLEVRRRANKEAFMWRIERSDLIVDDPPKILGSGGYGTVIQAKYRGTLVAIKSAGRLIAKRQEAEGSAEMNGLDRKQGMETRIKIMKAGNGKFGEEDDEEDASDVSGALAIFGSNDSDRLRTQSKSKPANRNQGRKSSFSTTGAAACMWVTKVFGSKRSAKKDQATIDLVEEIKILTMIRHPCITAFMGAVDVEGPSPMLVLECMTGGSLYDRLHNKTDDLPASMIVTILHDVTTGLQFLHSADPPICHGDVNSKNVLIDSGNRGKVADFGLNHEGHDFAWRGTVRYMAPELFDSEPITKMSDVYSFGILLCECFERQTPYRNLTNKEVVEGVRLGMRPRVPLSCPSNAWRLMCMCWEFEKRLRPRMDAVGKVLEDMLESGRELQNFVLVHKGKGAPKAKKFALPEIGPTEAKDEGGKILEYKKQNTKTWIEALDVSAETPSSASRREDYESATNTSLSVSASISKSMAGAKSRTKDSTAAKGIKTDIKEAQGLSSIKIEVDEEMSIGATVKEKSPGLDGSGEIGEGVPTTADVEIKGRGSTDGSSREGRTSESQGHNGSDSKGAKTAYPSSVWEALINEEDDADDVTWDRFQKPKELQNNGGGSGRQILSMNEEAVKRSKSTTGNREGSGQEESLGRFKWSSFKGSKTSFNRTSSPPSKKGVGVRKASNGTMPAHRASVDVRREKAPGVDTSGKGSQRSSSFDK